MVNQKFLQHHDALLSDISRRRGDEYFTFDFSTRAVRRATEREEAKEAKEVKRKAERAAAKDKNKGKAR